MKPRITVQIIGGRLVLSSVIECRRLRVPKQFVEFILDTGSPDSYLSDKDVRRLHIPIKGRTSGDVVDFGGSRFNKCSLPSFKMYLLKEGKVQGYYTISMSLSALKTTKSSEMKIQRAQTLPSILGLDFLRAQKLALHVFLTEDLAYLQFED